ncbi:MAG TPA: hypothetical protein VLK36_06825 [Gaiellaceae bacterium]|nr:hypothetical protein [Gaiellaceae bacterium]
MTTLFTVKCFWPGVTEEELRAAIARVRPDGAEFRGAYLLSGDDLVLALFDGDSAFAVRRTGERAGMPCERVIETVWIAPSNRPKEEG